MAEEDKSAREKKKSQLRFNVGSGGVLGGVVLLGGGLAAAGLMAAFAIIKNRNSGSDDQKKKEDSSAAATTASEKVHDGTQGLSSVLQNPTTAVHQNYCCANHVTPTIGVIESPMDSRELVSAHNMALEDKPIPKIDAEKEDPSGYQQEILFSDELNKEITESCDEILKNEETSAPAPQIKIKNESGENFQLIDTIEVKKEDEPAGTEELALEENSSKQSEEGDDDGTIEEYVMDKEKGSLEGEISPKENSTMQPVEEEEEQEKECDEDEENLTTQSVEEVESDDEDDHDHDHGVYDGNHDNNDSSSEEEDVIEKEEESSEGTGSSSRESNVEAIWPTDMIEALSHELKVMNANKMAKTECDYTNSKCEYGSKNETTENAPILNKKTPQEFVMAKVETMHLPTREVCVWTLLALLLLLLLLNIHRTSPLQDLSLL